mmetsp:Transcript_93789/g.268812  ORF Transcript_93789/g.268812 Transcript_93789/m.268812 type:complete len:231 (-) Transcript_93789:74-766(-)
MRQHLRRSAPPRGHCMALRLSRLQRHPDALLLAQLVLSVSSLVVALEVEVGVPRRSQCDRVDGHIDTTKHLDTVLLEHPAQELPNLLRRVVQVQALHTHSDALVVASGGYPTPQQMRQRAGARQLAADRHTLSLVLQHRPHAGGRGQFHSTLALRVLQPHVRSGFQQVLHHEFVSLDGREHERRVTVQVDGVHVRTELQQDGNHAPAVILHGLRQRCPAMDVHLPEGLRP